MRLFGWLYILYPCRNPKGKKSCVDIMKILCFESAWSDDPDDEQTVSNLLQDLYNSDGIDYEVEYCVTKRQLQNRVKSSSKKCDVVYFATHGKPGKLIIGGKDNVDLLTLSEWMDGKFAGKVIYLSACSILDLDDKTLRAIVNRTGAKYICGYSNDVDWMEGRALDTLVLQKIKQYKRPSWLWKHLKKQYGDLMKKTGFYQYW